MSKTLSDKIGTGEINGKTVGILKSNDVKEFIRQLKLEVTRKPVPSSFYYPRTIEDVPDMINELAGEKLI